MDAPHVLNPVDLKETFGTESDLDAVGASETSGEEDPSMAPRGWWHPKGDRAQASMEASILVPPSMGIAARAASWQATRQRDRENRNTGRGYISSGSA